MCSADRAASLEPASPSGGIGCASDAECTQGKNGRCRPGNRGVRSCTYDECLSDAECTKGGPCICKTNQFDHNRCAPGNCRTDADCGEDGYCSPSLGSCGNYSGVVGYYCHTCMDECAEDSDCKEPGGYCAYEPTRGHWRCAYSHCVG